MKTAYGKLAALTLLLIAGLLLLSPMRSGVEDALYARPHAVRMARGDTYAIQYTLISDKPGQDISFSSVNQNVATVDSNGIITAVSSGKTQIHLSASGGAKNTVQVEVAGNPATSLTLNTDAVYLDKGQVTGLKAEFNEGAEDTLVEWMSADESIAKVDALGRVAAMGGGSTRIVAATPGGLTASAMIYVHVSGNAIKITPADLVVGSGAMVELGTFYLPEDTTDEIVHWSSDSPDIVTIDDSGALHAVGEGRAVVSAFSRDGLSASTFIHVERSAESFSLSPAAATVERGHSLLLTPVFTDESGQVTDQSDSHYIVWKSSNPDVATVENGFIRTQKSGTTRITASSDGFTAICNLRVQVLVHEVELNMPDVYLLREQANTPIQLHPVISPADPDDPTITYSTSNDLVANVTSNGLVSMTGGYGSAVITARAASGAEAHFTVNVVSQMQEMDLSAIYTPTPSPVPEETPAPDFTPEPTQEAG